MYAIIEDGGRQFKVEEGQELTIDYRESANAGDELTFDKVLALRTDEAVTVGTPTVEKASVKAEVVGTVQGPKLIVQKIRRRKNSRRKTGHRQAYTTVKIQSIESE